MMKKRKIAYSLPYVDNKEIEAIGEIIKSGWWTTGKVADSFEKEFTGYLGSGYALAVNSATAALHLALKVIGVKEPDEVIVPTMAFAATAEVVIHCGARPILCDCDPQTLNIDIQDLKKKISRKTKAIIPVHMAGLPCQMEQITRIARKHGLYVIEDAAHALGAEYRGKKAGTLGDIAAFSFYATKPISTGEGGMFVTNNKKFMALARSLSLHGLSHGAWLRYSFSGAPHYKIIHAGFKYNMPDILAALGVYQLKKADSFLKIRHCYAGMYSEAFKNIPWLEIPLSPKGFKHAWHLYIIKLNLKDLCINRDEFAAKLRKEGVQTSIHFIPLHLHPFYRKTFKYTKEDFPNAARISQRILSLPLYPSMKVSDVKFVISRVLKIATRSIR